MAVKMELQASSVSVISLRLLGSKCPDFSTSTLCMRQLRLQDHLHYAASHQESQMTFFLNNGAVRDNCCTTFKQSMSAVILG